MLRTGLCGRRLLHSKTNRPHEFRFYWGTLSLIFLFSLMLDANIREIIIQLVSHALHKFQHSNVLC